tara:strand:- start:4214 stop:4675 length:462 start_codon:yes stop_codon:yes gene_type:complete
MYRNERSARSRNRKAFPGDQKNRDREAIVKARGARLVKESDLQTLVLDYLALQKDCFAMRINTQGVPLHGREGFRPSPMRGVSDILVCIKGNFLAIELKSKKKKPSIDQETFLNNVAKTGGYTIVAKTLESVIEIVEQIRENEFLGVKEDEFK